MTTRMLTGTVEHVTVQSHACLDCEAQAPPRICTRHTPCSGSVPSQRLRALAGPVGCRGPGCSVRRYVGCGLPSPVLSHAAVGSLLRLQAGVGPRCPSICISTGVVAGPKVPRHDGAVVGPARSAARGPARGAARVSPKKPSRSRPVVRPGCPSMVLGETVKDLSSHRAAIYHIRVAPWCGRGPRPVWGAGPSPLSSRIKPCCHGKPDVSNHPVIRGGALGGPFARVSSLTHRPMIAPRPGLLPESGSGRPPEPLCPL
jgi:hypothetical protein